MYAINTHEELFHFTENVICKSNKWANDCLPLIRASGTHFSSSPLKGIMSVAGQGISQTAHLCRCPVWRDTILCLDDCVFSTVGTRWNLKGVTEEVPWHPRRNGLCLLHSVNGEVHRGHGFPTQEQGLLSRADGSTHIFSRSKAALAVPRKLQKVQSPVPSAPVMFTLAKLSCREHFS